MSEAKDKRMGGSVVTENKRLLSGDGTTLENARSELLGVLKKYRVVVHLSWDNIKVRYARSVIGPFWLVLATAISALGLGYIWSTLFHQDKGTFIPALCVGLIIWQFISSCILEASNCYIENAAIIKNTVNPVLMFPLITIIRNLLIFCHNLVIIAVVFLIYPPDINYHTLLLIPGIILVIGNLIWMVGILGFLGARYRDIAPAITSMMTIMFFLSPVMYKPDQLGLKAYLMWLNPFTYLISLIRDPLTGHSSPWFSYVISTTALLVGYVAFALIIEKYRYKLPYWL